MSSMTILRQHTRECDQMPLWPFCSQRCFAPLSVAFFGFEFGLVSNHSVEKKKKKGWNSFFLKVGTPSCIHPKNEKRKQEKTILSNRDVLSRRSCFFLQVPCVSYPVALLDAISRSKSFSAPPFSQRVRTTSVGEQSCAC